MSASASGSFRSESDDDHQEITPGVPGSEGAEVHFHSPLVEAVYGEGGAAAGGMHTPHAGALAGDGGEASRMQSPPATPPPTPPAIPPPTPPPNVSIDPSGVPSGAASSVTFADIIDRPATPRFFPVESVL